MESARVGDVLPATRRRHFKNYCIIDHTRVIAADGSREPGDMEDRAAKYLQEQNLLFINGDFRAFIDMTKHFTVEFGGVPGVADIPRALRLLESFVPRRYVSRFLRQDQPMFKQKFARCKRSATAFELA